MKTKLLTALIILMMGFCSIQTTRADDGDELDAVGDVFIVRPASFVATIIGGAVFVVALPVAAMSRSVKQTAKVLVLRPAHYTFTRPIGEFDNWAGD
jgi:hypothetical protein